MREEQGERERERERKERERERSVNYSTLSNAGNVTCREKCCTYINALAPIILLIYYKKYISATHVLLTP
jgi:hypothetical protein